MTYRHAPAPASPQPPTEEEVPSSRTEFYFKNASTTETLTLAAADPRAVLDAGELNVDME